MNIVHICLNGPFTENWSYQENVLAKYHVRLGHNVTIIAQNAKHLDSGEIVETQCENYINTNGVRVIRVKCCVSAFKLIDRITRNYDIFSILCDIAPDFIMVHGFIGSFSALQVKKYLKNVNHQCHCVVDIHQDEYNSHTKKRIKYCVAIIARRFFNNQMYPFYKKIFCVAPSSLKFAKDYYRAPVEKLELLPLGCDPEFADLSHKEKYRNEVRKRYLLEDNDILICHGGKMDEKKGTAALIAAIKHAHLDHIQIKLILFGSFSETYAVTINREIKDAAQYILYAGMLKPEEYYKIYMASDIAIFPGGQSVLWQQAISCGLATIVSHHFGTEYLDLGGNIKFLENCSENEIYQVLIQIITNGEYLKMKQVAEEKALDFFSYERIAQRVLECVNGAQFS